MMSVFVAVLYIVGYLLVVASIIVAAVRTPRSIEKMQVDTAELRKWWTEEKKRRNALLDINVVGNDAWVANMHRNDKEVDEETLDRARQLDVPITLGLAAGSDGSAVIASSIRHVARANKPTALIGLSGGLLSTIASVWSLFL